MIIKRDGKWGDSLPAGEKLIGGGAIKDTMLYPKRPARALPPEVPENYAVDYKQAAAILELSPKASAAIARRLLQQILRDEHNVKPSALSTEIEQFIKTPHVPSSLADAVDAIRNYGNFAAHAIKSEHSAEIIDVDPGEAEWLLDVLESLFDFTFVQPERLKERRQKLNEKLHDAGKPPMKGK